MSRKRKPAPALSGVPGTPGHPDYPPITAAQCKDLKFARRLVRQMRDYNGGRPHQRDRLRRASRDTHEFEAFKHLYHGAYSADEQRTRDAQPGIPAAPAYGSFLDPRTASLFAPDPLVRTAQGHIHPNPRRIDSFTELAPAYPHHPGWWCDWTPAFDRARNAQLRRELSAHPTRSRWQDCSIGDAVHARHFPVAIDDPLAVHPLVLHWPVNDHDTSRTFSRIATDFWARLA